MPDKAKNAVMETVYEKARAAQATVVLAESNDQRVAEAATIIEKEKLARLILLDEKYFSGLPETEQEILVHTVVEARTKNGVQTESPDDARRLLASDTKYLAAALVKAGKAGGYVAGNKCATADTIRPALKVLGTNNGFASSFFLMLFNGTPLFFADGGFNIAPTPEQLAKIAVDTARSAQSFGVEPRVAFLSFSTAGSAAHESIEQTRKAIALAREAAPDIAIAEQELQFDAAFDAGVAAKKAPAISVAGHANVFIFPDLGSGNIAYKIAQYMGGAQAIGPLFQGFKSPVNDLSRGCSVQDIVDVVAVTAMQAGTTHDS